MNPLLPFLFAAAMATPPAAPPPPKQPGVSRVPERYQFVRSLEVEPSLFVGGRDDTGAQALRVETRYLDPDVNAFVGLVTYVTHFNERLTMGEDDERTRPALIWNWGAAIGIVRGRSAWAIDLMGVNAGSRVGFGPALVGEHAMGRKWTFFHRTAMDFFTTDTVLDSDQGVIYALSPAWHVTVGYRIFAGEHISRSGPRMGILWRFQSPKIPFMFPSLG